MEGRATKRVKCCVSPLRLHRFLPIRDVRKLVWRHLNCLDREMVRCAQNAARVPSLRHSEMEILILNNYVSIAAWLLVPAASQEAVLYWSQVLDMCIYSVRPDVFAAIHAVIGRGWKTSSYEVIQFCAAAQPDGGGGQGNEIHILQDMPRNYVSQVF